MIQNLLFLSSFLVVIKKILLLKTGFAYAKGDYPLTVDFDLSDSP